MNIPLAHLRYIALQVFLFKIGFTIVQRGPRAWDLDRMQQREA
jgi:hypothetical protein